MVEEVLTGIFRIEVPLPNTPLKDVYSYAIRGDGEWLVIDTGMNNEMCKKAMDDALREIGVKDEPIDVIATHFHADHVARIIEIATRNRYISETDSRVVADEDHLDKVFDFYQLNAFPDKERKIVEKVHPGIKYYVSGKPDFTFIKDKEEIKIGQYRFVFIETPGHTPGHMCLYEPEKKIFIAGDHILRTITPNISQLYEGENVLKDYLTSLDKVSGLDVSLVLPAHREVFDDFSERIQELKLHHDIRCEEVLSILEQGTQDAFRVASQMTWCMRGMPWEEYHATQKFFATGEAIAHLDYLAEEGKVKRSRQGEMISYRLA